jgi:putative GTP pyrophosphokinase
MMSRDELRAAYERRYKECLVKLKPMLEKYIRETVGEYPRIDRIVARAKAVDRFMAKAGRTENGALKYSDPLKQIQDQLAARIVTYYLFDVGPINHLINDYFGSVEEKRVVPESESEFGYEGWHHVLFIPRDIFTPEIPMEDSPEFFELQVNTLFQHAWAEANHDLGYKPPSELQKHERRKIAFTAAQAWGADVLFNELAHKVIDKNAN